MEESFIFWLIENELRYKKKIETHRIENSFLFELLDWLNIIISIQPTIN